jgi:hypothetical protein
MFINFKKILIFFILLNSNVLSYINEVTILNNIYKLGNLITNNKLNCNCVIYGKYNNKIFKYQDNFIYYRKSSKNIAIDKIIQIQYNNTNPLLLSYHLIFESKIINKYNFIKMIYYNYNLYMIFENKKSIIIFNKLKNIKCCKLIKHIKIEYYTLDNFNYSLLKYNEYL